MNRDKERLNDTDSDEEREGLLPSTLAPPPVGKSASSSRSSSISGADSLVVTKHLAKEPNVVTIPTTPAARSSEEKTKELAICRICLEEDLPSNLDIPCGCAGTQRHAHQACIQRWVEEKGHTRCEICGQIYKGDYTAPPPPPSNPHSAVPMPMFILESGNGGPATVIHRVNLDEEEEDDSLQHRNPAANCAFTTCIFVLFLVILHHTMILGAGDGSGADYGDGMIGPMAPGQPSRSGPGSYMPAGGSGGSMDDTGSPDDASLFMFLVMTKVFLIGIPLLMIMKVAQRQAERQQYEQLVRGAMYDANRRFVVRLQQLRGGETV